MTVYSERIDRIRETAGLSSEDVARVVGATARTVARWATGANTPRGETRDKLLQLAAVTQQLSKVMTRDAAAAWLHEPNALLGNLSPMDLIKQGRASEVLNLIDAIADGVHV